MKLVVKYVVKIALIAYKLPTCEVDGICKLLALYTGMPSVSGRSCPARSSNISILGIIRHMQT